MAMDIWMPNLILSEVYLPLIPIWVQLWGLPLEYQNPTIARRFAQIMGVVTQVDWNEVMLRNLRFMRVKAWINPYAPLIAGGLLLQDDGVMIWIEFRYERVYKICRRCGTIGHTLTHCPHLNLDIKRMIGEQMDVLQRALDTILDTTFKMFSLPTT